MNLLFTFLFLALTSVEDSSLTIEVPNLRNTKGEVRAALFKSEAGFPKQVELAFRRSTGRMEGNRATIRFEALPPGDYAIVVIHDENWNGKFDTGPFGIPKEGYGFSRNVKSRLGPPPFSAARFAVAPGPQTISISLNY